MTKGPPVGIRLDLGKNLRTRHTGVGTYIDATALAEGEIRELKRLGLGGADILNTLRRLLQGAQDAARPWRLVIILRGRHEFSVEPEYRRQGQSNTLILRVVQV